jgi:hypothetical protein
MTKPRCPIGCGDTDHRGARRSVDAKGGDDGVVAYESAHLDDVDSELVINSSHSVQGHPLAISEMRRILLQHLQAVDSGQTRREPPKSTGVGAAAAARVGAGDAPAASSGH